MRADDVGRLLDWFAAQLPEVDDVQIEGLDRVAVGHSAETTLLTLVWREEIGRAHV